jgi:regulatory protein
MTVTGVVELDKRRSKVFLDGEFAFVLYKGELRTYHIKKDTELSVEQYQQIMTELLPKRAKLRAMNLLTNRAYTESKLRQKLQDGYYPMVVIQKAIDYVKSFGYVDDHSYAMEYITYHAESMNRQQMEIKLMQRGISKEQISCAFDTFYEENGTIDEIDQINRLLVKKHYNCNTMNAEEQYKIKAMLYRKGFSSDNISKAMDAFT